ncbi:phospholipid/cholesterol/gamma-HCH transport system substrate-binding protein [Haloechinothrix alba]|uniref:Phospholipid/cholesterol/gamma-HCH transport system substrate-binding protein n=1 Tax=Haloechinothrix alba TaxID=664784 RepID=A0A239AG99_9PSEU|nr:MlaD family protein [Haloechinothrix alba]SNR94667.1 phospholipid/cholesterol/gamma-HCH transport system substrate-binding protein [Haloechinothrix alba]
MKPTKNRPTGKLPVLRSRWRTPLGIGIVFLALAVIVLLAAVFKGSLVTLLRSGETITAEFSRNYQLHPADTAVKVAGLEEGVVTGVEETDQGTVKVSMKVDESALDALGPKPSAIVTPNTLLGGAYSVELRRGGGTGRFEGDFIPRARTQTPTELDRILESLPQPTRESARSVVKQLDETLASGGTDALRDLVADAPQTLRPAGDVLKAAQGRRPGVDLPRIVSNFHTAADVLSRHQGQLGDIVTSLRDTTAVLAERSQPLAAGIASLPATLRDTRTGLIDLRGALDKLNATADSFRPTARELEPLLGQLDPVLRQARPLLRDLRPLLRDARPLVEQLVPVTQRGTAVLNDVRGPVLQRVNGPIASTVMNTWHGTGPYKNSGRGMQADHKFYEELGYLAANVARASMVQDAQGSLISFQAGANTESLPGIPLTMPNLVEQMKKYAGGSR